MKYLGEHWLVVVEWGESGTSKFREDTQESALAAGENIALQFPEPRIEIVKIRKYVEEFIFYIKKKGVRKVFQRR